MNNEQLDIIDQIVSGKWWFVTTEAKQAVRQLHDDHYSSEAHVLTLQLIINQERNAADRAKERLINALTKIEELEDILATISPCSDALVQERDELEQENDALKEMVRTLELQLYAGGSVMQENEDLRRQLQHANFLNTSARHILEDQVNGG